MSQIPLAGRPLALLALALMAGAVSAQTVEAVNAFPGLTFKAPVELAVAPGDADRVYVVEQDGRVRTATLGASAATLALDLTDRVVSGGEMGLLGLAFHPDYDRNGRVFVHYTAADQPNQPGRAAISRVSEFARSASDPLTFDPASERVVLAVDQPESNHNGGKIAFGPDGFLYVALGDGGGAGDPYENGQDPTTLLGAILRMDVDDVSESADYGIPSDNPFVGHADGWREEIYAYGFRNPWKFSFDSATGDLWVGDVGQSAREEIDLVKAGGNYGWNEVEGDVCYTSGCDLSAYEAPVYSYPHSKGQSISGGFVYRGTAVPALAGRYVYGDFVSGRLWAYDPAADTNALLTSSLRNIASVNEGPDGEAYVVSYGGTIYRLVPFGTATASGPTAPRVELVVAGPTPFRTGVDLVAHAPAGEPVRLVLVDALGRTVRVLHDGPTAGALSVRIDGAGLAPGVYLVRLVTATASATVPVVRGR